MQVAAMVCVVVPHPRGAGHGCERDHAEGRGWGMEKVGRGSDVPAHRETRVLYSTVPRT